MSEMAQQNQQAPTGSPEHLARLAAAKAVEESKREPKVLRQWIEVHKRVPNEIGKVLLKTTTDSGQTHSWYVGRETKAIPWLKQQAKEKVEIFMGPRVDEHGRPGIKYIFPKEK
jgi:hypothetical protein